MHPDRREFLQLSVLASALVASPGCASAARGTSDRKLAVLVLGGTGFIGPALVEAARQHGHTVTLFNRGRTNKDLFPDVERIVGDRDPKKGAGISGLAGRKWDVVFDDCGYYPRHVAASAGMCAQNGVGHYVYVSSISCYAKTDVEGADETAELATMDDPAVETMGEGYRNYGPLKALCEKAAEAAMPGRTTVIRPGYIVGPGDPTDRFTYWPVRFDQGGTILVPGTPTDPLQVIDVRDLSAFMLLCSERGTIGTFNACGPEKRLPWGEVIDACKAASSAKEMNVKWLPTAKVMELRDVEFPIWAPYVDGMKGTHTCGNARAVAAGLRFRPIRTIVADTLAWWKTLPAERRAKIKAQFDPAREAEILKTIG